MEQICLLTPDDTARYAEVRRAMLAESPRAFTADPASDPGCDAGAMATRLRGPGQAIVAAKLGDEIVGAAGLARETRSKLAHRALLWGVWVRPEARGRGLGERIVSRAIDEARAWSGVRQVVLIVCTAQREAVALYRRLGFVEWGVEPDVVQVDGVFYDEMHMHLELHGQRAPTSQPTTGADAIRAGFAAADYAACVWPQFGAALDMLEECIRACPDEHWDDLIAKYPFWHVVYHTLCFVDVYLCPTNDDWVPQTGPQGLHPLGRVELDEEYPSRRFTRAEMLRYMAMCREKLAAQMARETAEVLRGPSGFGHLPFSRAELHVYSVRHVQHHTGQLGACLRRAGVDTRWVKSVGGARR